MLIKKLPAEPSARPFHINLLTVRLKSTRRQSSLSSGEADGIYDYVPSDVSQRSFSILLCGDEFTDLSNNTSLGYPSYYLIP